jgi:hypothetical protein
MCTFTQLTRRIALRVLFPRQLAVGAFFLNLTGSRRRRQLLMERLEQCPDGSLGREVWLLLRQNGYEPVTRYENHDLKHVLLGYRQEAEDEIRMQAFMFGNAGFSVFSVLTFLLFVVYTPRVWRELPFHYRSGALVAPIGHWTLATHAERDVAALRAQINLEQARLTAASLPGTYRSLVAEWMALGWWHHVAGQKKRK